MRHQSQAKRPGRRGDVFASAELNSRVCTDGVMTDLPDTLTVLQQAAPSQRYFFHQIRFLPSPWMREQTLSMTVTTQSAHTRAYRNGMALCASFDPKIFASRSLCSRKLHRKNSLLKKSSRMGAPCCIAPATDAQTRAQDQRMIALIGTKTSSIFRCGRALIRAATR
jgi:hypothetical protein